MTTGSGGRRYGVVSGDRQRTMSGLEFVQGLSTGTLPMNSMAETLGYYIVEVSNGRAVIAAEPTAAHLNPAGTVRLLCSIPAWGSRSTRRWIKGLVKRHLSSRFRSYGHSRLKPGRLEPKAMSSSVDGGSVLRKVG